MYSSVSRYLALTTEFLERSDLRHPLAVGGIERQREIDAVHDRVVGSDPLADLAHDLEAKGLPVGKVAEQRCG